MNRRTPLIIDPLDTRMWISMGIEAASQPRVEPGAATREFNMGVLQT